MYIIHCSTLYSMYSVQCVQCTMYGVKCITIQYIIHCKLNCTLYNTQYPYYLLITINTDYNTLYHYLPIGSGLKLTVSFCWFRNLAASRRFSISASVNGLKYVLVTCSTAHALQHVYLCTVYTNLCLFVEIEEGCTLNILLTYTISGSLSLPLQFLKAAVMLSIRRETYRDTVQRSTFKFLNAYIEMGM